MGRGRQRADRIRQEIPIIQVLYDLGYRVRLDGGDREQQFPCDLHGDGSDNKPSARVYPDSNSWYCFACSKPRDAITTLRDRMDLGFSEACKSLEKTYGLSSLPWSNEEDDSQKYETISSNLRTTTFEQAHSRIHALLEAQRTDREIPLSDLLGFWEAHDMIVWRVEQEQWDSSKGITSMMKLKDTVLEQIKRRVKDEGATAAKDQQ